MYCTQYHMLQPYFIVAESPNWFGVYEVVGDGTAYGTWLRRAPLLRCPQALNRRGPTRLCTTVPHQSRSEGRINKSGHLECGYHGWEFSASGKCEVVPQVGSLWVGKAAWEGHRKRSGALRWGRATLTLGVYSAQL